MNHLKPYLAYRELNLPWLESIPEHWQIQRGKVLFDCIDARSSTGDEELLTVSSDRGIIPRKSATVTMFKAESYEGYKLCWPGDLVINSLWAWAKGLGVSKYHGIISSAYGVYRLKPNIQGNIGYIHELVRSSPFQWELQVRSKGIWTSRLQLTDDSFLNAPFPFPPLPEQNAIVRYLDHMERRIRRYINAKRKLIALLNERKQAIIHRAVTRGLDPNVRFKPSRVEWIGDIPEHWEVRRLKTLSRMKSGENITAFSIEESGEYPVYGGNGIRGYTSQYTHEGDYLLIGRQGALCGNVHHVMGKFWASEHAVVVSIFKGYDIEWCCGLLEVMNLNQYSIAAAQPGLAVDRVLNLWSPIPPYSEQLQISEFVRRKIVNIMTTIEKARREIDLLREYRTRLIADVVTGKLDVREATANLPEEVEEEPIAFEEVESLNENGEVENGEEVLTRVADDD